MGAGCRNRRQLHTVSVGQLQYNLDIPTLIAFPNPLCFPGQGILLAIFPVSPVQWQYSKLRVHPAPYVQIFSCRVHRF